ncbi:hypothetical protein [Altericista sp. CCNU0014]|uniref:hypothetical protein n=1 Tax=Altericista sp. CCNU0014 TaxID=3082949 RepID=UPI00384C5F57
MKKVLEVIEVKLFPLRTFPAKLKISASGTVPTGGWSHPQLVPFTYIQAPPDGIYDFDFVAEPPDGSATQAITPIAAEFLWENLPQGLKGIRIHASANSKVAFFSSENSSSEGETEEVPQPNRFAFTDADGTTKVVFFPRAFGPLGGGGDSAEPQLEYEGPEGRFVFRGADIVRQESPLGSLISATLIPNADAGGLSFALALPPVVILGQKEVEFETIAIKIAERRRVFNPLGAVLSYKVLNLKGLAERIPLL